MKIILRYYLRNLLVPENEMDEVNCIPSKAPLFHIYHFQHRIGLVDELYVYYGSVYRKRIEHNILTDITIIELEE